MVHIDILGYLAGLCLLAMAAAKTQAQMARLQYRRKSFLYRLCHSRRAHAGLGAQFDHAVPARLPPLAAPAKKRRDYGYRASMIFIAASSNASYMIFSRGLQRMHEAAALFAPDTILCSFLGGRAGGYLKCAFSNCRYAVAAPCVRAGCERFRQCSGAPSDRRSRALDW